MALSDNNYAAEVRLFDDGVPRGPAVTNNRRRASILTAGPPGFVFGAAPSARDLLRVPGLGVGDHSRRTFDRAPHPSRTNIVYAGGRVYANSGDVIDVTNPTAPVGASAFPYTGSVAARDPRRC